jgi:DNA-binding SARP family transcriptional activator
MEFGILGPVEAYLDGKPIGLGGPKQRALLAVLLLHRNEAISRDRLIDALWGERPPPSAAQTLDTYVSRLKKLIGSERLVRRAPGYMLRVEPNELDLDRFEALLAVGDFEAALSLWRGPALADLLFEPFAAVEAERLEDRRIAAVEERIDARLAAGHGPDLVPQLEQLVREHPLRERLLGQLMLALYRTGRQAAALDVYRATRRALAEELGLEPGPQLQELERRILAHDPALGAPSRVSGPPARPPRRRAYLGVAVVVAGGVLAGVLLAVRGSGRSTGPAAASSISREVTLDAVYGRL